MEIGGRRYSDEDDFEPVRQQAQLVGRRVWKFLPFGLGLVFVGWLLSGIYIIQPGEQGVVLLFGSHIGTSGSGINYRLPWPLQSHTVVDMQAIRRAEIGFRSANPPDSRRVLEEALMLTRDENIVEVGMLVQYRVKDPVAFVFRVQDPEDVLRTATEVALREAVGKIPIDGVITERRAEVQDNTRAYLERLLDGYGTGIQITDVRLQVADAPDQVRDAFHEVVRAREDRERKVNEAQAYREDVVPKGPGEAQQILQGAIAYREERVRQARGESDRFTSVLNEYRSAPQVTRERMYIETMERVYAKVEKILLSESQQSILPFLPLRGTGTAAETQATTPAQTPQAPASQSQPPAQPQPQQKPQPAPAQPKPSTKP